MSAIKLQHDIELYVATALNRKSVKWVNKKVMWSALVEKLTTPIVTSETYKQFMAASKEEQGGIKDQGGFVGGYLEGGKRNKENVRFRQVITLDIDFSSNDLWWLFTQYYGCAAVIHSTHKSTPEKPRHRLIIPLDRRVSGEEYQAISRKIAEDLNIDLFDQTTFDVNRLMYWPTVSRDMEFYSEYQDGPILSADSVLDRYEDWRDTSQWPTATDYEEKIMKALTKQEDPTTKKGMVGYFCRTYTIEDAIDTFLSDIYEKCDTEGRYTYKEGSTSGGLVLYQDMFAYSHHDTDPAGSRLCNAFDLVRIHLFGNLDTERDKGKPDCDKKSFKAMEDFVAKDVNCKKTIAAERLADAQYEFSATDEDGEKTEEIDTSWMTELSTNVKGEYENTANNICLIVQNDAHLKGAFRVNDFDNKRYVCKSMPWRKVNGVEPIKDVDYAGVRNYIERVYGVVANQKVDDAISLEFEKNRWHPVKEYLNSLEWDGTPRVNHLLQDYFGVVDNEYTSAAMRKMLCAAVARVMVPGTKFDLVLILVGPQGTYKSTFIKKLGRQWFSDTFTTVQGKESFEQIQGFWIIEMAELSGLRKAEIETIKLYVSKRSDSFRPAYGREVVTFDRQCVFFGTTNSYDFLRDPTGNRRFLPCDVRPEYATKSVIDDLTESEIDQIWAEAYQMYKDGEPLYLRGDEELLAKKEQHQHSERDERRGIIESFINMLLPKDWEDMDLYQRREWLSDPKKQRDNKGVNQRQVVCVSEVWCECLHNEKSDMRRLNTKEINEILRDLDGWEPSASTKVFPIHGTQRYYKRKND